MYLINIDVPFLHTHKNLTKLDLAAAIEHVIEDHAEHSGNFDNYP